MCLFIQKLDDTNGDYRYYCTQCCFEPQKIRYVLNCWERGCTKHCSYFGENCIRNEISVNQVCVEKSARYYSKDAFYRVLEHKPGQCFACGGSGLAESVDEKICNHCSGSGICSGCHGQFVRFKKDLKITEYVREW